MKLYHVKVSLVIKRDKNSQTIQGGNHLIIKEPSTGAATKKICGSAPKQRITSVGEEITFILMVPKPGNKVNSLWLEFIILELT